MLFSLPNFYYHSNGHPDIIIVNMKQSIKCINKLGAALFQAQAKLCKLASQIGYAQTDKLSSLVKLNKLFQVGGCGGGVDNNVIIRLTQSAEVELNLAKTS